MKEGRKEERKEDEGRKKRKIKEGRCRQENEGRKIKGGREEDEGRKIYGDVVLMTQRW